MKTIILFLLLCSTAFAQGISEAKFTGTRFEKIEISDTYDTTACKIALEDNQLYITYQNGYCVSQWRTTNKPTERKLLKRTYYIGGKSIPDYMIKGVVEYLVEQR